jgi:hypothetical protein
MRRLHRSSARAAWRPFEPGPPDETWFVQYRLVQ